MVMTTKTEGKQLKEQTWPETKPRILREPKIRRLEVIGSNHFVVSCEWVKTMKTLRVDANFFENGEKNCGFKRKRMRADGA